MPSSCPAVTAQSCPATKQCLQYKSSISGGKSPETIWPVTEIRKTVLLSANDMITINTTQVHWWFQQWAFIFSEGFLYKRHPNAGTYLVLKKVTQPTLSVHLSVIMKLCCLLTTYVDGFFFWYLSNYFWRYPSGNGWFVMYLFLYFLTRLGSDCWIRGRHQLGIRTTISKKLVQKDKVKYWIVYFNHFWLIKCSINSCCSAWSFNSDS